MKEEITLTKEELEELKDEIRFRERVVLQLKRLNNVPDRVTKLETKVVILMWGIPLVIGLMGLFLKFSK